MRVIPTPSPGRPPPTCTATLPLRLIRTPENWPGITSTFRGTIGMPITPTSEFCFEHRSIRVSDAVKWIKPGMPQGEERDVMVTVGEPGGIWALDRETGEFLWATPFPYDVPDFHISHIDVETGATYINWDKVFKKDGDRVVVCYHNTKGYWPMAYHPGQNSLYIPIQRPMSRYDC